MSVFKDKVLLITGGTGSFGNAVLRRFLDSDIKEIRIFSRDEKKQDDMRHRLQNSKVKFYIGNVRNKTSVDIAMRGVDYVFAAAALKQVPSCEFFPMEATRTNVLGTGNVLLSAIEHGVKMLWSFLLIRQLILSMLWVSAKHLWRRLRLLKVVNLARVRLLPFVVLVMVTLWQAAVLLSLCGLSR